MFTIKETETCYLAFNPGYEGSLSVYVDGSFECDYAETEDLIPMGAGWSIADKDENLIGYGMASLKMPVTKSAEKFELNSMVNFLDALRENFPERVNRRFPVTLICDNQALIGYLNDAVDSEEGSRICHKRYEDYYLRLSYYMESMDLKFAWVKGHDSNDFNRLADFMAKKSYFWLKRYGSFSWEERNSYSEYITDLFLNDKFPFKKSVPVMTQRQLRNIVSKEGMDILTSLPTLWVGMHREEYKGRTFAGFSFADSYFRDKGDKGGVFLSKQNDFSLTVRAINYALNSYSGVHEVSTPLVVRTDNSQAASLLNTIRKGNKWRHLLAVDPVLNNEVEKLKAFLVKQPVIGLEVSDFALSYKNHQGMMDSKNHTVKSARTTVERLIKAAG